MHLRSKVALATLCLVLVLGGCYGFYYYSSVRVDTSTIDYIKSMQKHANDFLDVANDINVESAEDIGYVVKGYYKLNIYYGDQIIEMNQNCFNSEDYRNKLSAIGIDVKSHDNGDGTVQYKITYWGDEVTEWSRVDS